MADAKAEELKLKREAIEKRRALFMREEAVARFIDDSEERVNAWQLTLRQVDENMNLLFHEARFVELVYRQPEGWADGLTEESHGELYDLAVEINLPIWLRRKMSSNRLVEKAIRESKSLKADSTGGTSSLTPAERLD